MANLTGFTIHLDGAPDLIFDYKPGSLTAAPGSPLSMLFGGINLATPAPVAPTGAVFAANPGAYENTPFDRTIQPNPHWWDDQTNGVLVYTSTYLTWADWFKADKDTALRYFEENAKAKMDLTKLGPGQKLRMGLA